LFFFFFTHAPPSVLYTLSLHDALPISSINFLYLRLNSSSFFISFSLLISYNISCVLPTANDGITTVPCLSNVSATIFKNISALRSEEHTSELQSRFDLVCRLLLEKKNI